MTRLKPTQAALAARGIVTTEQLEVRTAERDRAVTLVDQLERLLTKVGGYMVPADQAVLGAARALLVEVGRRTSGASATWEDRVQCVVCKRWWSPHQLVRHHCAPP